MNQNINAKTEEGFQDLEFGITQYQRDDKGNHIVIVHGHFMDELVGFKVLFIPNMEPGVVEGKLNNSAFYPNGVKIGSIGPESDNFIKVLSQLYNVKHKSDHRMCQEMRLTSFCLDGDPNELHNQVLKFKVFHDDSSIQGLYAEFYINIDISNKMLEFREKDTGFRKNIVMALSGRYPNIVVRLYKKLFKKI